MERIVMVNRPFHGFFNFCHEQIRENPSYPLKKGLKISKIAKFETDLLKTNEGIAPQSPEVLQTFV